MIARTLGESAFHRIIVIAGATAVVIIALFLAKSIYSTTNDLNRVGSSDRQRSVADNKPEIETISFVTSPAIETNPQFLFGAGDGSNGYYAERP